jgi:hypothetical protein
MLLCLGTLQMDGSETKLSLSFYINHCVNWGSGGMFPKVSKEKIVFIEVVNVQHVNFSFDLV